MAGTSCSRQQKHYPQTAVKQSNDGLGCTAALFGLFAMGIILAIGSLLAG